MIKIILLIVLMLMSGCSMNPQNNAVNEFQNVDESTENEQISETTEEQFKSDEVPIQDTVIKLFIFNQQEFYKNGTIFAILDADGNPAKYRTKSFGVTPMLMIEKKNGKDWESFLSIEYDEIESREKQRVTEVMFLELNSIEYESGIYRIAIQVTEEDESYLVYSEEMMWNDYYIYHDEIEDNEFLKIYPFSQYNVNGSFVQNGKEEVEDPIQVSAYGCAVTVKPGEFEKIHQVYCKVLNASTCKQETFIQYLPKSDSVFSVKKAVNGYRDEEFYKKNIEITGKDLFDWFTGINEEDIIVIPSCFSLGYHFDGYETYSFSPIDSTEEFIYRIYVDDHSDGVFVSVFQIDGDEELVVSNQYIKTGLPVSE